MLQFIVKMIFYYNPLDKACKSVVGAISHNEQLKIKVLSDSGEGVVLHLRRDDETNFVAFPMQKVSDGFFVQLNNLQCGIYWYLFSVKDKYFGVNYSHQAEADSTKCFQLTVFDDSFSTPNWLKGGIFYQIFPDRFNRSSDNFSVGKCKIARYDWGGEPTYRNEFGEVLNNEFFGGDLKGIASKMDYLVSLGVTCIYLNPISKAFSSHRYDTGNYLEIDELLGTEEDLMQFLEIAKSNNIKVIFDGVYNHTGADSVYFNRYGNYPTKGAFNAQDSPYFNWFEFERFPAKYKCWWDFENLPSIRKDCKDYQNYITKEVIPKFMKLGFSGVRLDVVDELNADFVEDIRSSVKDTNAEGIVIGEVWEDATNKIAYGERRQYFCGKQLDSVMNYQLKVAIVDFLLHGKCDLLRWTVEEQINNYPKEALNVLMNVLSTHDSVRILTELGRKIVILDKEQMANERLSEAEYKQGKKLLKLAYALTYMLYGLPSVYYGDEVGLYGNLDPYNRRCYPYGQEDFELLDFFKKLAEVRKNVVFAKGATKIIYAKDGIFIFERYLETSKAIIVISRSTNVVRINFTDELVGVFGEKEFSFTKEIEPNTFDVFFDEL